MLRSRVVLGVAACAVGCAGVGAAVNSGPLTKPALRAAAHVAGSASPHPLSLTFEDVEGTLLFPATRLRFVGLHIQRLVEDPEAKDRAASVDVYIDELEMHGSLGKLTGGPVPVVDALGVRGVVGTVATAPNSPPLPHVVIESLSLANVGLSMSSQANSLASVRPLPVVLRSAEFVAFDLGDLGGSLARAKINGVLDGQGAFALEATPAAGAAGSSESGGVFFNATSIPLHRAAVLCPPGAALEWMTGGTMDVHVLGEPAPSGAYVKLQVAANLVGASAGLPPDRAALMSPTKRTAARLLIEFVNSKSRPIHLEYTARVRSTDVDRAVAKYGSRELAFASLFVRALSQELVAKAGGSLKSWFSSSTSSSSTSSSSLA